MTVYPAKAALPVAPRIEAKKPRIRTIVHEGVSYQMPSVTTVLDGAVANPKLADWRVQTACEDIANQAEGLYTTIYRNPIEPGAFLTSLYRRLGSSWADKRVSEREAGFGTAIHDLIEWHLKGEMGLQDKPMPEHISDSTKYAFDSWLQWRSTVTLKPIMLETEVYSVPLMTSGRLDIYAEVDGMLAILDWKPLKNKKYPPYASYKLQLGGYSLLAKERGIAPIDGVVCVRLSKTKVEYDATTWKGGELAEFERLFVNARQMYGFLTAA